MLLVRLIGGIGPDLRHSGGRGACCRGRARSVAVLNAPRQITTYLDCHGSAVAVCARPGSALRGNVTTSTKQFFCFYMEILFMYCSHPFFWGFGFALFWVPYLRALFWGSQLFCARFTVARRSEPPSDNAARKAEGAEKGPTRPNTHSADRGDQPNRRQRHCHGHGRSPVRRRGRAPSPKAAAERRTGKEAERGPR